MLYWSPWGNSLFFQREFKVHSQLYTAVYPVLGGWLSIFWLWALEIWLWEWLLGFFFLDYILSGLVQDGKKQGSKVELGGIYSILMLHWLVIRWMVSLWFPLCALYVFSFSPVTLCSGYNLPWEVHQVLHWFSLWCPRAPPQLSVICKVSWWNWCDL